MAAGVRGRGSPRIYSAEAERAGHALGGGQPSGARLSAAKSLPASTYLAFGVLGSVTSGRGERSEPRTYPHGEAGAEGSRGRRPLASDARCRARVATEGSAPRPTPSKGAREPRRGTRRRQPINNEAGERSAPPPLEAERGQPRLVGWRRGAACVRMPDAPRYPHIRHRRYRR